VATDDYEILDTEFHLRLQGVSLPAKSELPSNDPFTLTMNGTVLGGTILLTLLVLFLGGLF
jgi:hypothetical protein